jgi:tetratricopeptide (TPR) repeat protein
VTAAPHPSPAGAAADAAWSRRPWLLALIESGPALIGVGVFLWWTASRGGFAVTRLYPGALVILAALAVLVVARPERPAAVPRLLRASIVLGGLFALVTLLSILWADVPGEAWTGANRTVAYVAVFALFALTPFKPASLGLLLGVWAVGVAAIALAALMGATTGGNLEAVFQDRGRLGQPIGYANATSALLFMAFWPAAVLASRRQIPVAVRALLLAAAFVLVDLAVLAQSRASVLALPLSVLVAFAVVPGRVRLLLTLLPVVVAAALTVEPMLDVFGAETEARAAAVDRVLRTIAIGFGAVFLAGLALALADRRIEVGRATARRADLALGGCAAVVAAVAVAVVAVAADPIDRVQAAWEEFASGDRPRTFEETRFTGGGLGDYRADYWRVSLRQFREEPLLGVGADNFGAAYIRERRTGNEAKFPHSTPLAILSSTGLVGAALFLGFVMAALASYLRARREDTFAAAVGGAAVVVFAYWFIHGSVDWFWEIPALGAPALAFLGAAAALRRTAAARDVAEIDVPRGRAHLVGTAIVAAAALVAAAAATPPWLAARQTASATTGWRTDPEASLAGLERASRLNPVSERADLLAGTIANRTARHERARALLLRASERNPLNWYVRLELAIAEERLGRHEAALEALSDARRLNPREEVIDLVGSWLAEGEPIDLDRIDGVFRERIFLERLPAQRD